MNRKNANRRSRCGGFTLVEISACAGICAVLLGQAIPALGQLYHQQKLRAVASAVATDLRLARSEAARTGHPVFFRISGRGANGCYLLHTGAKDDCDCAGGQAVCKKPGSEVIKAEWLPPGQPLRISSNAETFQFQYRQGLVTQTGSIELRLDQGPAMRHVVAITGRARTCAVGATWGGMPACI